MRSLEFWFLINCTSCCHRPDALAYNLTNSEVTPETLDDSEVKPRSLDDDTEEFFSS